MNTVNSRAQHSQFDFRFRFLLLHILAQGEKIESVLFQPILVAYPTRHSWIISAHINLGTLNKPMHMFNKQKNIVRETIFKLRNHPDDAIEPLQPLQVKLDNLHNLFMAYKPVFSSARSILQTQPSFDGKPIPPSGSQLLLLIDVPIQDRAQQIQIYKIINLPVPVGNYSMRYTMDNKYLGVTYDRTKAMDILEDQFKICKEANGQFCPLTTPLKPLTNPPLCVADLCTKNS